MPLTAYAAGFARLALANITREYPNFPAHLVSSPEENVGPSALHPADYEPAILPLNPISPSHFVRAEAT